MLVDRITSFTGSKSQASFRCRSPPTPILQSVLLPQGMSSCSDECHISYHVIEGKDHSTASVVESADPVSRLSPSTWGSMPGWSSCSLAVLMEPVVSREENLNLGSSHGWRSLIAVSSSDHNVGSSYHDTMESISRRLHRLKELDSASRRSQEVDFPSAPNAKSPNSVWRTRVAQWCYDVVDHLRESRSIVFVAMSILDQHCSTQEASSTIKERDYELASMTAAFLAIRLSGSKSLHLTDLISMSRGGIQASDVVALALVMAKSMKGQHRTITPHDVVKVLVELLPTREEQEQVSESALYLVEVAVCDEELSGTGAMNLAIAAVLNSLRRKGRSSPSMFVEKLHELSGINASSDAVCSIQTRLDALYSHTNDGQAETRPHVILDDDEEEERRHYLSSPIGREIVPTVSNECLGRLVDSRKRRGGILVTENNNNKRLRRATV